MNIDSSILLVVTYLIEHGGIFGLFLIFLMIYIAFKEYTFYKKIPENELKITQISSKLDDIKNTHENFISENDDKDYLDINDKILDIQDNVLKILAKSIDLWDWHNIKDNDGIRNWYFKSSLQNSINEMHESIVNLESSIDEMHETITTIETDINDINHNDNNNKTNLDEKLQKINDKRVVELKSLLDTYNKTIIGLTLALEKIRTILNTKNEDI